jgi:hypothetical protein
VRLTAPPAPRAVREEGSDRPLALATPSVRAVRSLLALAVWSPVVLVPVLWALDDVAVRDVVAFGATVLFLGTAPGLLLWRAIRPAEGSWAEDLTVGFAVGLALGLAGHLAALATGLGPLRVIVPLLPLLVLLIPARLGRLAASACAPAPWWVHVVGAASTVTAIRSLHSWFATQEFAPGEFRSTPYVDTHFHLALVTQLLERGPVSFPALLGEPLDYHWFQHGWMAWTSTTGGIDAAVVLMRLQPAVMPLVVALAVVAGARRVSGSWVAAALAAPLVFFAGAADIFGLSSGQSAIIAASPTLAPGAPLLVGVLLSLTLRWRGQAGTDALVLAGVLAFAASCTKGSSLPPLIAGVALAAVAGLIWRHPASRRLWVDLAVLVGVLVVSVVVVFRGAAGGLRPDVVDSISQTVLGRRLWPDRVNEPPSSVLVLAGVSTVLGTLARAGGLVVLAVDRKARRDPALWTCLGATAMAAGALVLFWHPGSSQYYFARSAVPLMAIGSAVGLELLLRRVTPFALRAAVLVVPACVAAVATLWVPRMRELTETRPVPGAPIDPALQWDAIADAIALARTGLLVLAVGALLMGALVVVARGQRVVVAASAVAVLAVAGTLAVGYTPLRGALTTPLTALEEPVLAPSGPARTAQLGERLTFSQEMVDAASWLRTHAGSDDVVMTNRHCATPRNPLPQCDARRWLVSAFAQRQMFIESWAYTSSAVKSNPTGTSSIVGPFWNPADLALNDGFYTAPTADAARGLWCRGVRWVYVDRLLPTSADLDTYAPLRLRNVDAEVRELPRPSDGC